MWLSRSKVSSLTQKRRHPLDKILKKKDKKDVEKEELPPKKVKKQESETIEEVEIQIEEKPAEVNQTGGFNAKLVV